MLWYAFMFNKERDEEFDYKLNMTEYLASFINSEGVRQVKDARENKKEVPDEEFDQLIRDQFGRDLNSEAMGQQAKTEGVEEPKPIKKKRGRPRKVDSVKGPKLLPESKSRPAVDQTAQKEVKAAM